MYSGPVNYKDAAGTWQPIDVTISSSSKSGFARENVKNLLKTYFAEGSENVIDVNAAVNLGPLGWVYASASSYFCLEEVVWIQEEWGSSMHY